VIFSFGTTLANSMDELRNGRAEMIRATGAVLIASVLLYFIRTIFSIPSQLKNPSYAESVNLPALF
jgi:hypothetical protein